MSETKPQWSSFICVHVRSLFFSLFLSKCAFVAMFFVIKHTTNSMNVSFVRFSQSWKIISNWKYYIIFEIVNMWYKKQPICGNKGSDKCVLSILSIRQKIPFKLKSICNLFIDSKTIIHFSFLPHDHKTLHESTQHCEIFGSTRNGMRICTAQLSHENGTRVCVGQCAQDVVKWLFRPAAV